MNAQWEQQEIEAAAREAAAIGGRAGDEGLDPALRPLIEAGEGEAEGFELAEQDLIDAVESGDPAADPLRHSFSAETARGESSGEADEEGSSEVRDGRW